MPNNYSFFDSDASILTAESSIISGSVHRPIITIASFLSAVPTTASGNQSVSGTVLVNNGSVVAFQSLPSSLLTGSSIFGQLPGGTAVLGSIATLQGTNPWNIAGSVLAVQGTWSGSVLAFQGTSPWAISSVYGNISGSVLSQQLGTRITSVVGSIPSSLLTGIHGHRNDTVASYLGGDLSWRPIATDSAGRILSRPFAPEESRVEGYVTLTSTSLTTLVAAAGAGLRNYITDLWFANTGATTTLITFTDSAASVLGYTIAPTASGSNLPGLLTPIRTGANASFNIQAGSNTSTLYATVKGFKGP